MGDVVEIEIREEKPVMINVCGPDYDSRYETRWPNEGASESLLAQKLVQTYTQPHFDQQSEDDQMLVSSMGSLWRCGPLDPLWHEVSEYEAGQRMLRWDNQPYGPLEKTKKIQISVRAYRAVYQFCTAVVVQPQNDFFRATPHGFATRDAFVRVDCDAGTMRLEPLTAQHRCRAGHSIAVAVDLDCPDMTVFGRPGTMLHKYLSTIHGKASAEEQAARCLAMGQVAFAALTRTGTYWHRAIMLFGPKGCGKSQFLIMLEGFIPEEARCSVSPQNLSNLRHTGNLEGKALNTCFEASSSIMETETFKAAVCGESIAAEPKWKNPYVIKPVALHAVAGNVLIRIRGTDPSIWDRWLSIKFSTPFRDTKRDVRDIGSKVVDQELSEIVHWALLCGRPMLAERGYSKPTCDAKIVKRWKRESDPTLIWIDERCDQERFDEKIADLTVSEWTTRSKLFEDFRQWLSANDFARMSSTTFYRRLADHGFPSKRSNGRRVALDLKKVIDTITGPY